MRKKGFRICLILTLMLVLICAVTKNFNFSIVEASSTTGIKVHYIDVGQGDATFIEFPDNRTMLIDAGTEEAGETLSTYISNLGVTTIDYVVASHSDSDHIGGLAQIFEDFEVRTIIRPFIASSYQGIGTFKDELYLNFDADEICVDGDYHYANFLYHAYTETVDGELAEIIVASSKINIVSTSEECPYIVKFFYPTAIEEFSTTRIKSSYTSDYSQDSNSCSSVILVETEFNKFVFTGDATIETEGKMLESLNTNHKEMLKDVDVLKVGHHGSNSSTGLEFLNFLNPKNAIISVGEDNTYGLPSENVLTALQNNGSKIYRTDEDGTIIATESETGELSFSTLGKKKNPLVLVLYVAIGVIAVSIIVISIFYPKIKERLKNKKIVDKNTN